MDKGRPRPALSNSGGRPVDASPLPGAAGSARFGAGGSVADVEARLRSARAALRETSRRRRAWPIPLVPRLAFRYYALPPRQPRASSVVREGAPHLRMAGVERAARG